MKLPAFGNLRSRRAAVVLALALPAALCVAAAPAEPVAVDITKFAYQPKEITIEPGTRVRWTNHDETPHTVTSRDAPKAFASKALDTDDQFEFTFTTPGDFAYFCTVHPFMTGVVHVRRDVKP